LTGTVDLITSDGVVASASGCSGKDGYSDLAPGAPVTVKDESGKLIGTGSLDAGKAGQGVRCTWKFSIDNLPDAKFYQVEVSHRGELNFSKADLDKAGWKVFATVGD
jgi:hypothetical protein